MKKILLASAVALTFATTPTSASIILNGATPADALVDLSGQGFGAFPRMLTLQTAGTESGSVTPVDVVHGDAIAGQDKSSTPTLGQLGWNSGSAVDIVFNADQTGQTGITLNTLVLTVFNGTTAIGSFSLAAPVTFTQADLALEKGNGNGVFSFVLDAGQQAQFNTLVAQSGSTGFFAGLNSSLGNPLSSNDGPDTFYGVIGPGGVPVPGPALGAGVPGVIAGCLGLLAMGRRRIRKWRIA